MSLLKRILGRFRGFSVKIGESRILPPSTSLLALAGFRPINFIHGVEILNDNTTKMEFVVYALMGHLAIPKPEAKRMMLRIHTEGGILIPVESQALAEEAARSITNDALAQKFPLVCRAVQSASHNVGAG
jgi:ATP-dependent Clp protease adapter protein ClpS